ncbi:MAG: hypothetical protein ACI9EW_003909, partial [Cellvibrionaceae bacterium]
LGIVRKQLWTFAEAACANKLVTLGVMGVN